MPMYRGIQRVKLLDIERVKSGVVKSTVNAGFVGTNQVYKYPTKTTSRVTAFHTRKVTTETSVAVIGEGVPQFIWRTLESALAARPRLNGRPIGWGAFQDLSFVGDVEGFLPYGFRTSLNGQLKHTRTIIENTEQEGRLKFTYKNTQFASFANETSPRTPSSHRWNYYAYMLGHLKYLYDQNKSLPDKAQKLYGTFSYFNGNEAALQNAPLTVIIRTYETIVETTKTTTFVTDA